MSNFYITGRIDDVEYTKAEMLAHHISSHFPAAKFTLDPKSSGEFMMHRITLYTRHRWADRPPAFHRNMTKRCNDIDLGIVVCRASGELIGNSKDFIAMMKRSYGVQLEFPYELIQDITAENIAEFNSKLEAAERIKIEENLRKREEQIQAANAAKPREHSYSNPGLNSRLRQAPTSFIYGRNGVRDSTFFVTAVATHVHGVLSSNSTSPSSSKPASAAPTLPTIAAHS